MKTNVSWCKHRCGTLTKKRMLEDRSDDQGGWSCSKRIHGRARGGLAQQLAEGGHRRATPKKWKMRKRTKEDEAKSGKKREVAREMEGSPWIVNACVSISVLVSQETFFQDSAGRSELT